MKKLENRIAIVTGAASGMGKATAKKMAEYGAIVNMIDFSPEVMNYAEELKSEGYEVTAYQVDVREAEKLKLIYKEIFEKYGRIDALVNSAGVAVFTDFIDDSIDLEAHREIDINYFGVWNSCRAAVPYMKEAKYGKIVHQLQELWYVILAHQLMQLQKEQLWLLQKH